MKTNSLARQILKCISSIIFGIIIFEGTMYKQSMNLFNYSIKFKFPTGLHIWARCAKTSRFSFKDLITDVAYKGKYSVVNITYIFLE